MPKRESNVVGREFGNTLRAAIAKTGLTQRKLAEELDWDESKLSDLVNGKGGVSRHEVEVSVSSRFEARWTRCGRALSRTQSPEVGEADRLIEQELVSGQTGSVAVTGTISVALDPADLHRQRR